MENKKNWGGGGFPLSSLSGMCCFSFEKRSESLAISRVFFFLSFIHISILLELACNFSFSQFVSLLSMQRFQGL